MLLGLVGRPNTGKSTFFKAATLSDVEIGDRPFVTIKPNHGIGYVRIKCLDKEFGVICDPSHGFCIDGNRFIPVEIMDVAGLVEGASEGKGLGNQFLDNLREADAFIHIVDISGLTDSEGKNLAEPIHDVLKDVLLLEIELHKWFSAILRKVWRSFSKKIEIEKQDFSKAVAKQFSGLKINEEQVKKALLKLGIEKNPCNWSEDELMQFSKLLRNLSKPMIIAANKIDAGKGFENYNKLRKSFPELKIIPCSAETELGLREAAKHGLIDYIPGDREFKIMGALNEKQKSALNMVKTEVLNKFDSGTGVQKVLDDVVFEILGYIAVFPASANKLEDSKGNVLPDCFLLKKGSSALDFAYHIHTDFGDNFIKAVDARTKRILGKNYELKNRDAVEIITK